VGGRRSEFFQGRAANRWLIPPPHQLPQTRSKAGVERGHLGREVRSLPGLGVRSHLAWGVNLLWGVGTRWAQRVVLLLLLHHQDNRVNQYMGRDKYRLQEQNQLGDHYLQAQGDGGVSILHA